MRKPALTGVVRRTRHTSLPLIIILAAALILELSCRRDETFPVLGTKVAGPVDVVFSKDGSHIYVLNSDFDRTYNQGSVLVLDESGNKIRAVEVPRMGRTMALAGDDLLVGIGSQDDDHGAKVILFDVSDPASPVKKKEWSVECDPFSAVLRNGYEYFALSCTNGALMIGTLKDVREQSTLKLVRDYPFPRRALHLDPTRDLLLGFVTEPGKPTYSDNRYIDVKTFDANGNHINDTANEVPDEWENSRAAASNKGRRPLYQFFVYDLKAERSPEDCPASEGETCVFPYRSRDSEVVTREMRWLYFDLADPEGNQDVVDDGKEGGDEIKYYRTNFFEAKPAPGDSDSFYLSHRGITEKDFSPHANNIIKVTITGDLRAGDDGIPTTSEVLAFERVYGFSRTTERGDLYYTGDFELAEVGEGTLLLVNHFRDLGHWKRSETFFTVTAKLLGSQDWITLSTPQTDPMTSWYQVALGQNGRAASLSFYGHAVMLLDVQPDAAIKVVKRIE